MAQALYRPLGACEIRLLKLKSSSDLSFEFVYVDVDKGVQYAALSYTWGDAIFPRTITINGCVKHITQNLFDALSILVPRMRKRKFNSPVPDLLWIDAVCINQSDFSERSKQVQLMKTLYENAASIYVWLGQPQIEANVALAVDKMKSFEKRSLRSMKKARPYRPWWWPVKDQPPDDAANMLMGLSPNDPDLFDGPGTPTHNAWLGIFSLLDASWWDRTWIYQEATIPEDISAKFIRGVSLTLNDGKIRFYCGNFVITWNQLRNTVQILYHLSEIPGHRISTICHREYASFVAINSLRFYRWQNKEFPLLEILNIFRNSQCKDLRDKVYAPLTLASQSAIRSVVPDYERSVLQVYMDVVRYQLREKGHEFDFLGYVAKVDNRPPLPPRRSSNTVVQWPSWLPDWSVPASTKPFVKLIHVQKNLEGRSIRPYDNHSTKDHTRFVTPAYRASGDLEVAVLLERATLRVHAVICDTIQETTDFDFPNPIVDRWRREVNDMYWTGEPWMRALYRTYTADIQWATTSLPIGRNGMADREFMNRPAHQINPKDAAVQRSMNMSMGEVSARRRLCLTTNKSLGLVPDIVVPGDKICMFFGSQVLHILRVRADITNGIVHTYIGEAYIHGLMDGQVLDAVRLGRMEDKMVTIV